MREIHGTRWFEKLRAVLEELKIKNGGKHWNCLHREENLIIYKIRLACRYLRATTMRVIYAHHTTLNKIVLLELYYKSEKENEDVIRIETYLKSNLLQ